MKKVFNQCWLGLKQPKIGEKCHFYDTFKPFLWILTCFGNLNMKWVEQSDIELLTSKYERKHAKVDWITLHSHGNALVIPLIFHVLPQKSRETQILKKNDGKSCIFNSFTLTQIVSADILSSKLTACYYFITSDPFLVHL